MCTADYTADEDGVECAECWMGFRVAGAVGSGAIGGAETGL